MNVSKSSEKTPVAKTKAIKMPLPDTFDKMGLELVKRLMDVQRKNLSLPTTINASANEPVGSIRLLSMDNIRRARRQLDRMQAAMDSNDLMAYNMALMRVFSAVPRPLEDGLSLVTDSDKMSERLVWESAFVDAVEKVIADKLSKKNQQSLDFKLLENYKEEIEWMSKFGLSIQDAGKEDIEFVKDMMGSDSYKFVRAWKVYSRTSEQLFENYVKKSNIDKTTMLWHGSPTVNFISILQNGLSLSKASYGMFGKGIYFAPKFDKSRGYCSVYGSRWADGKDPTAFLAISEVATGNPYYTTVAMSSLTEAPDNKDCVWARHGQQLRNDEVIIYNQAACRIKYIVETN